MLGQNIPDLASLFHPSLSQSSDQILTSSDTHFANTNEMNLFAYPNLNLGTPSLSSIMSPLTYGFPLIASSGSSTTFNQHNANAIDRETFDFTFLPTTTRPSRVYVANNGDDTISIIDPATNTVIETIPGGGGPQYMALTPDKTRLYVDHCCARDYVWVIDTASNTLLANITLPSNYELAGVAANPNGASVYVVGFIPVGPNTVFVIGTATNTVVATIALESPPVQIAVNPAGTRAYVTLGGDLSFDTRTSVIDTAINTVIDNIPVGTIPFGVAVSPDGTRVYVTNAGDATVSVISTATNTAIATIPVGARPVSVAFTPDGTKAYVTNTGSASVSVIDTATNTVIATIPVGNDPEGIAIT